MNSASTETLCKNITPELIKECEIVLAAAQPATGLEIAVVLHRLSKHYPERKMSEDDLLDVSKDWLEDLDGLPLDIIEAAVSEWRRGEKCEFFPKSGQILRLVDGKGRYRLALAQRAGNIMSAASKT